MTGYETVNWGDKRLYDGATIRNRDRFLYGGAVTLEVDAYLTDRIILSLSGRERCLWGTTTGHFPHAVRHRSKVHHRLTRTFFITQLRK